VILRQVFLTDLKEIIKINNSVQTFPWSKKAVEDEFINPLSKGFVVLNGVNITGYAFVRSLDSGLELMTLGVGDRYQRQGVGTYLLGYIRGLTQCLILEVSENNLGALTLYKRMGFEIFGTRKHYYPDGSSALCMKLNIANP
jgi:[ribosomal protein S18]-alanine N-acetyltransferase